MIQKLKDAPEYQYDFIVIGGGATGAGIALEAISRGYSVFLFEKSDFAKSTSGRSTKLIHGGVRYLSQGNFALVRESCIERRLLLKNAPHLVKNISFIIPVFNFWDELLYTFGLKFYDLMAGGYSIGRSKRINREEILKRMPGLKEDNVTAGILYRDGQFDDSRLVVSLLLTAAGYGAGILNYMPVESLIKNKDGQILGVKVRDSLSNKEFSVRGKVIINATGVFADEIIQMVKRKEE